MMCAREMDTACDSRVHDTVFDMLCLRASSGPAPRHTENLTRVSLLWVSAPRFCVKLLSIHLCLQLRQILDTHPPLDVTQPPLFTIFTTSYVRVFGSV